MILGQICWPITINMSTNSNAQSLLIAIPLINHHFGFMPPAL